MEAKARGSYEMTMWSVSIVKYFHEALQVRTERRLVDPVVREKLESLQAAGGTRTYRRQKHTVRKWSKAAATDHLSARTRQ